VVDLSLELDNIIKEINEVSNELEHLRDEKELIKEKISKIKKAITKLKLYLFNEIDRLNKLKRKIKKLNNEYNYSYKNEVNCNINIKKYGLSDLYDSDEQLLTPEMYKKIADELISQISKTKGSIEFTEHDLEKKQDVLDGLKGDKKEKNIIITSTNKRLKELRNYKLEKFSTIKENTTKFEDLNKHFTKTKKR